MRNYNESEVLLYNNHNVFLDQEKFIMNIQENNTYYFEFYLPNLNKIISTIDIFESIVILIRQKNVNDNDSIWNIDLTNEMKELINFSNSFYWLTDWLNINSDKKWSEVVNIYEKKYLKIFNLIINESKKLSDVKYYFKKYFKLIDLYEFTLENVI